MGVRRDRHAKIIGRQEVVPMLLRQDGNHMIQDKYVYKLGSGIADPDFSPLQFSVFEEGLEYGMM